jgi:hypothetical protein
VQLHLLIRISTWQGILNKLEKAVRRVDLAKQELAEEDDEEEKSLHMQMIASWEKKVVAVKKELQEAKEKRIMISGEEVRSELCMIARSDCKV